MFLPVLHRVIVAAFLLACGGISAVPAPAAAQELQPLPELSRGFDLAKYAAQTDTITKEFPGLPNLAFEIALPKSWLERVALGQAYGEIARFDGPAFGDVRPYFSFKRVAVPRENSAKLELVSYALKQGYVLRSLKEVDDRNAEAVYVVIDGRGDSYIVRTVLRIMGPDMLLAEYAVPVNSWDRTRDEQTFAISSFKFLQDSDAPIEKRIERSYFQSLRFFYPASWVYEGDEAPHDNRVTLRFATSYENVTEAGRMRLTVVSPRSLKDDKDVRKFAVDVPELLKELRGRYEALGYDLGEAIESRKPDLNLPTRFAVLDVYNMRRRMTQYETDQRSPVTQELWLAVFAGAGDEPKTYVMELFTPSRAQDLYLWATNVRAMEIVLKSIQ